MNPQNFSGWLTRAAALLTPRRLRTHAVLLAVCLWTVCAVDYATPGIFDRAGNIKFQDFLQFPISARLILDGRAAELYDDHVLADRIREIVGQPTEVRLQYFYGPQVALPFVPLARLPFLAHAAIWVTVSLLMYAACVFLLWKACGGLSLYPRLVAVCALAYPPLFHFFVRGQLSAVLLACFTAAYLFFVAGRPWLVGIALGCLAFKPQFLVALPIVLLLGRAWTTVAGLAFSAGAQMAFAAICFGSPVMRSYFNMLLFSAAQPGSTELSLSPIQMHSLRSFWALLIPWPRGVWVLYLVSAFAVMAIAGALWRSSSPRALRFSALILAAVLVNPHLYIYDLLALAPALMLLANLAMNDGQNRSVLLLRVLLYLAFLLPLFGPLSRWTHLQLSVIVFVLLLWTLHRIATPGHVLANSESAVV